MEKIADPAVRRAEFDDVAEVSELVERSRNEAPPPGSQRSSEEELRFDSLPLSQRTLQALQQAKLSVATQIQAAAIPHALAGRDILGAAKTGSGKTLAFTIPLVERLYIERWSLEDGLAAIIITPTRELAMQIFEVLRIVGKKHQLSAGLVTGGKKEFEEEQARIVKMNILVATPGRLLQHFEQTAAFDASQLLVLVLDEADRILDLGFKQQLDGIISYLPLGRQTMLFSATQTKSVKDLARLSLRQPEYLAVHDKDEHVTPVQLVQNYVVVHLPDKLDVLFSFIKSHLKCKIIVFFSTCSQVRYVHEVFRGMQPGIPLTALHGKIKQEKRTLVYSDFVRKKFACMLATDIAARGLDFPAVDWVVQLDAPEDPAMYVHRVGRTARYNANGRALLFLLPSEEEAVSEALTKAGVPIKRLTINSDKTVSVASRAAALLVAQPECRLLAKKAFTGYLRSLQLSPFGSAVGDVSGLPVDKFANSLGLAFAPPLPAAPARSMDVASAREANRTEKNVNRSLDKLKRQIKEAKEAKKREREAAKAEAAGGGGSASSSSAANKAKSKAKAKASSDSDSDSDGELLQVKRRDKGAADNEDDEEDEEEEDLSALDLARGKKRKRPVIKIGSDGTDKRARGTKVLFDDEGQAVEPMRLTEAPSSSSSSTGAALAFNPSTIEEHTRKVRERIDSGRTEDRQRERQRIKEKHLSERAKLREARKEEGGPTAYLAGGNEDEDEDDGESDSDDAGQRSRRDRRFITNSDSEGSGSGSGSDSDSDSDSEEEDEDRAELERRALQAMSRR